MKNIRFEGEKYNLVQSELKALSILASKCGWDLDAENVYLRPMHCQQFTKEIYRNYY